MAGPVRQSLKLDLRHRFARDLAERGLTAEEADELTDLLDLLRQGRPLPAHYQEHSLLKPGEWQGFLECHVAADWLLIYRRSNTRVTVYRTGTHAQLFGRQR